MKYDVCIIGGCGHVGLPLGMSFAKEGKKVIALDINDEVIRKVNSGVMPFKEEGAEELLKRVIASGNLKAENNPNLISESEHVIFIIGTPVSAHWYPTYQDFFAALRKYMPYFRPGQHIVLRSTIYPGTTENADKVFKDAGLPVDVSFCPERVSEGYAIEELHSLPQIISSCSQQGLKRARELFSVFTKDIMELRPMEAELAKLFTNTWRYIKFAVANQFLMIADDHGLDFYNIHKAATHNYPRLKDLPMPGFAAGPCLFKDTVQLDSFSENNFFIGHAALLINEGLPSYIARRMKERYDLKEMTVGILGMAFKKDSDDKRESLSYKLKNILEKDCKEVLITDPFVADDRIIALEDVLAKSDVLVIGAPHSVYERLDFGKKHVVDMWNMYGKGMWL